jgi:hypothetical protein
LKNKFLVRYFAFQDLGKEKETESESVRGSFRKRITSASLLGILELTSCSFSFKRFLYPLKIYEKRIQIHKVFIHSYNTCVCVFVRERKQELGLC